MPPVGANPLRRRRRRQKKKKKDASEDDFSADTDSILRVTIRNTAATQKRNKMYEFEKYLVTMENTEKDVLLCSSVNQHTTSSLPIIKKAKKRKRREVIDEQPRLDVRVMEGDGGPQRKIQITAQVFRDTVHTTDCSLNSKFTNLTMEDRTAIAERKRMRNRRKRERKREKKQLSSPTELSVGAVVRFQ